MNTKLDMTQNTQPSMASGTQENIPNASAIGRTLPAEWIDYRDPISNRLIRQLTQSDAANYPLYYFIPSITADGRYLIFHSERTGWVQLYRMDLQNGGITQLTDGHTYDCGWARWCIYQLRGIYNHLSALNVVKDEVYYFQDAEIYSTHVRTLHNRCVAQMPKGQISMGQTSFSPNGRWFAFIHTDRANFERVVRDREALKFMRQPNAWGHFQSDTGNTTLSLINTDTGEYRKVITQPHHFHHVIWTDDSTLLVNHPNIECGMWTISINGTDYKHLRPRNHPDAHEAAICHQVVTQRGIFYEASSKDAKDTYLGHYDTKQHTFREFKLPLLNSYVHTGSDPKGNFLFIEQFQRDSKEHSILSVHFPLDPKRTSLQNICTLRPYRDNGQREHAHPFLTPDRKWIVHVALAENGFSQIRMVDVQDLVDLDEYF